MLIDTPHRALFEARSVASLHLLIPREQIGQAIHEATTEIGTLLAAQATPPAGPWFAHHLRRPTDTFEFDVCFPVSKPITPSGRVSYEQTAATEAVRTMYRGGYEGLPQAWSEFMNWIGSQNLAVREDAFEVYVTTPRETADSSAWQTEMYCPLLEGKTSIKGAQ